MKYFEISGCLCRIRITWKRKKGGLITTGSSNAVLHKRKVTVIAIQITGEVYFMKKKMIAGILALIMAVTPFVSLPAISYAASGTCGVKQGPTEIFEGMATDAEDITIWNDKMAVSFAVGSNNYWNMTKGSILDICAIDSEGWGPDLVNDVELLMDFWTATGEYKGTDLRNDVNVTSEVSSDKNTVTVTSKYRYWVADPNKDGINDDALPLNVTQVYTLKAGDSHLTMETTVENPNKDIDYGNKALNESAAGKSSTGMFSGYSISTNAANMFGPYGYYPDTKATGIAIGNNENVKEYFGKFVTTYKDDYAVSLIMDGSDAYKGSSGYKDLYINQVLEAGKSYTFKGEVLVETSNSTASVLDRVYARDKINAEDTAMVSGTVKDENGKPVEGVNVIVKKDGKYMCTKKSGSVNGAEIDTPKTVEQPMVWAITDKNGEYSFKLPKTTNSFDGDGTYRYKLKLEAAGYTSQTTEEFTLKSDKTQDFTIKTGAPVKLSAKDQNGNAIPFRVEISGVTYENKCAGISTYFSNSADGKTAVEFNLTQADDVTFTASYGKDFESNAVPFNTNVTAGGVEHTFVIDELIDPKTSGWVSMDNHQHSDYGDGATTPKDLFNAQIAAKLHYNLVSDHDTRINNIPMKKFSDKVGRPYISNMEVSPGWGHWGVLNVDFSEKETGNIVNASTATPPEIIKAGHAANALVIVHHPYSDYGFLHNQDSVAGGHAEGWKDFDLIELQSTISSDGATLDKLEGLTAENYENISLDKLSSTIASAGISQMDAKALVTAFAFWNAGEKKYLSAGSDQHQATNTALYPGIIRQYAKVGKNSKEAGSADAKAYLAALKDGRSYVTMGPLFFTYDGESFGDTISADRKALKIDAMAVNGLEKVVLYRNGVKAETKELAGTKDKQTLEFTIDSGKDAKWYSYVAIDSNGNYAVSNPIWVKAGGGTEEPDPAVKPTDNGKPGSADKAKTSAADTGDNTNFLLLILLMTAAAGGSVALILRSRKNKGSKV